MKNRFVKIVLYPFFWLFSMSPIERRPKFNNVLRYFIFMDYDRKLDEAYVYYKTFILNLWLNGFFLAMYATSFVWKKEINLGLIQVSYNSGAPVDGLLYGYPHNIFPILAIITVVYSSILFVFKTDYLSKQRIINEHEPHVVEHVSRMKVDKNVYELRPWFYLVAAAFLVCSGFYVWNFLDILRSYEFYNYAHDFHAQTFGNFLLVTLVYFIFYQLFYPQFFTLLPVNFARSVLRHYIYHKQLNLPEKEKDHNNANRKA